MKTSGRVSLGVTVGAAVAAALVIVAYSSRGWSERAEQRDGAAASAVSAPTRASAAPAASPRRVVSLVPSITETLFALGIGERVVGVSVSCDFPPSVRELPEVGTFTAPVAEAIAALRPDLVLTSPSPGNQAAVTALQRAGIRVVVVQTDGAIEEARRAMLEVAQATGEAERGRDLVARVDAELAAVRRAVAGMQRPKVAVAVGREPLILAGPASYLGELVALAGGHNIADTVGGRWPQVGLEYLVEQGPEVIFDLSISMQQPASTDDTRRETSADDAALKAWASLASIPAVAGRRVYGGSSYGGEAAGSSGSAPASLLLRPGPRLGEAARWLATRLHAGLGQHLSPTAPAAREETK